MSALSYQTLLLVLCVVSYNMNIHTQVVHNKLFSVCHQFSCHFWRVLMYSVQLDSQLQSGEADQTIWPLCHGKNECCGPNDVNKRTHDCKLVTANTALKPDNDNAHTLSWRAIPCNMLKPNQANLILLHLCLSNLFHRSILLSECCEPQPTFKQYSENFSNRIEQLLSGPYTNSQTRQIFSIVYDGKNMKHNRWKYVILWTHDNFWQTCGNLTNIH